MCTPPVRVVVVFGVLMMAGCDSGEGVAASPSAAGAAAASLPACVPPPSGIVSWWRAEGDATDAIGANDGTAMGAAYAPGRVGLAFRLDGSGDYVEVPDDPSLDLVTGRSAEAWILPAVGTSGGVVVKAENRAGHPPINWFLTYYGGPGVSTFVINGSPNRAVSSTPGAVPGETWSHVAATSDGLTMRMYVDGLLESTGPSPPLVANPYDLLIGAFQRDGVREQFYTGLIDEVAIYDRALTGAEVAAIHAAGRAGKCTAAAIQVRVDVKPESARNRVHPRSRGVLAVAILTDGWFDARAVDPLSVEFGPGGATESHRRGHVEDVDRDGDDDLVLHFRTRASGVQPGDTELCLTGTTMTGDFVEGCDAIQTVGRR